MTALVHPRQTYYRCSRGSARTRPCRSRYINAKRVDRDLERLYRSLPFPATVRRELETKLRLAALDEERLHLGASTAAGGPEPCAGARDAVGGPVRRRPAGLRCVPPCSRPVSRAAGSIGTGTQRPTITGRRPIAAQLPERMGGASTTRAPTAGAIDASGIRAQNISQVDHARSSVVIIERFARVSIARVAVWHRSE